MDFYTVSDVKRPVRLKNATREFAYESLQGKYGDEAMKYYAVNLDDVPDFCNLSDYDHYDLAIYRICRDAPIRICENELLSGSATLGRAIEHYVPVIYTPQIDGARYELLGISHLTVGFERVMKLGVNAVEREIDSALEKDGLTNGQKRFYLSLKSTVSSMRVWHARYLDALKDTKPEIYENLKRVPFEAPGSYYEAMQSLWFLFAFTRLCGTWSGIGRIDEMIGPYLKADLENGVITIDQAREIMASFFIKGCEWIRSDYAFEGGDAQHYQNLILGGIDSNGNDVTNEVTYLVLDVVEELGISDFPISVRVNKKTDEKLLYRTAEVMRHGGGVIAVYDEDKVIDALTKFGYELHEARGFSNDGCWEVQIPGRTFFTYYCMDSLQILLFDVLHLDTDTPAVYDDYDRLVNDFYKALHDAVENGPYKYYYNAIGYDGDDGKWHCKHHRVCSVVSLFYKDCIDSGLSYLDGGPAYTALSPHISCAPDTANSLYAIKKLVFEDKLVGFSELMGIVKNDWAGHEDLRQLVLSRYSYYGNDNDEVDFIMRDILDTFSGFVNDLNGRTPMMFISGVSTFGRQIEYSHKRNLAVPFGMKKGAILSGNASPTPGTDFEGATAIIKSYCKLDLVNQTCGAALDIKLHPTAVKGEDGVDGLVSLICGFAELGGFFMQLDIMDPKILELAKKRPEDYKTLSVRVSGWNARFVTLGPEWQDMIIQRAAHGIN